MTKLDNVAVKSSFCVRAARAPAEGRVLDMPALEHATFAKVNEQCTRKRDVSLPNRVTIVVTTASTRVSRPWPASWKRGKSQPAWFG